MRKYNAMRKVSTVLAASAAAMAMAVPASAFAATASISPEFICLNSNPVYCWNDQNGALGQNNTIQLYNESEGNASDQMMWTVISIGPVSQHKVFEDTTLDQTYSTATVVQLEYLSNDGTTASGYCAGIDTSTQAVTLQPCSSGNFWVVPDYSGGGAHTLINAYETNVQNFGEPFYATAASAKNGTKIFPNNYVQYWQF
jgi:hypothetical protein